MGPHVARVRGDEEGQVADQAHAFRARVGLQARALAEQQELAEANRLDLPRQISSRRVERGWLAADELFRPLEIRGATVSLLERAEQGVVVHPVGLGLREPLERSAQVPPRAAR